MHYNFDIVILADGDYPSHALPLKVLREARLLVCCDNAGRRLIESMGRVPDAIVGDGDSLPEEFKERYCGIWHQVDEQDYNDLTKATRHAIAMVKERCDKESMVDEERSIRIAYLAATGKREDHSLGNISLMNFYRREFSVVPVMITDYGVFTAHEGRAELSTFVRQQVSIFNMTATTMSSEGLRWPISAYKEWWMGTLNEALGEKVVILADGEYIVFRTHEVKG